MRSDTEVKARGRTNGHLNRWTFPIIALARKKHRPEDRNHIISPKGRVMHGYTPWGQRSKGSVLLATIAMCLLPATASAQTPLTLPQAVSIALEKNPLRKAAAADQRATIQGTAEARSGLLPRITFSEVATRGNDPVYAFGTRLRQGRFTAADFALNRLNHPTPIGDFTTRLGGQWALFDSFANILNVRRASKMQQAA
ncbi:MAG TPA: TolC family protein, partial [Armatimonadota bacterium]|nr:TolC family protein [Armatimonadota bacterium]